MPISPGSREGLDPAGSTKPRGVGWLHPMGHDGAPGPRGWRASPLLPTRRPWPSPAMGKMSRFRGAAAAIYLSPAEGSWWSQGNGLAPEPPLLRRRETHGGGGGRGRKEQGSVDPASCLRTVGLGQGHARDCRLHPDSSRVGQLRLCHPHLTPHFPLPATPPPPTIRTLHQVPQTLHESPFPPGLRGKLGGRLLTGPLGETDVSCPPASRQEAPDSSCVSSPYPPTSPFSVGFCSWAQGV